jgi:hypothetical protein
MMGSHASREPVSARAVDLICATGTAPILLLIPRTAVDVARRRPPRRYLTPLSCQAVFCFESVSLHVENVR